MDSLLISDSSSAYNAACSVSFPQKDAFLISEISIQINDSEVHASDM